MTALVTSILSPLPAAAQSNNAVYTFGGEKSQEVPSGEDYAKVAENEFLTVAEHPLSTFGADVDTASYSNIRRMLSEGQLPPQDAVRIEEMLNYFHYDYPAPKDKEPFAVSTELHPCPWKSENQLLRIGVRTASLGSDMPPRNLTFLLDVSGSMSDSNKLPLLKRGLRTLMESLTEKDRVAIVVYAGSSGLVLPPTPGNERETIMQALFGLEAGGSTNGGQGIQLAYKTAEENFSKEGINRVILATDGDFNVGTTSQGSLERLIEEKRESGIFLTVLGLGTGNLKDSTMEMLADKGNGNYAYIDSVEEARKVLVSEGGGSLVTVAKDVKIQVEFNPVSVFAYRLIGYENRVMADHDFNDDKKDGGEMGAGHRLTVLYELVPPGKLESGDSLRYQEKRETKPGKDEELALVKIRYKPPQKDESILISQVVPVGIQETISGDFRFACSVAGLGMLLKKSKHKGGLDYEWVIKTAESSKGNDRFGYREQFVELAKKAQSLDN
ncbi:MAG: VWA domain-containing protein [Candidatus Eremiobacteraeota bacterium]|nr:VWA domain-containing protein [Candidatus Eremiobacteraeota bacterium]